MSAETTQQTHQKITFEVLEPEKLLSDDIRKTILSAIIAYPAALAGYLDIMGGAEVRIEHPHYQVLESGNHWAFPLITVTIDRSVELMRHAIAKEISKYIRDALLFTEYRNTELVVRTHVEADELIPENS